MEKESSSKDLLMMLDDFLKNDNQEVLVSNAKDIYAKIESISEPLTFKEIEYPLNVDTHIYMKKEKIDIEVALSELIILVDKFITVQDHKKVQFKS